MKKHKCQICGKEFTANHLSYHFVRKHNIQPQEYYDKYIGKTFCKTCGAETKFKNVIIGYKETCKKCNIQVGIEKSSNTKKAFSEERKKDILNKRQKTNLDKFGVECVFTRPDVQAKARSKNSRKKASDKYKKTMLEKYGVDNYFKTDECREKCQSDEANQKRKESLIRNSSLKLQSIRNKIKDTTREKYGVNYYVEYLNKNNSAQIIKNINIEQFELENDCTLTVKLVKKYGQGWYKAKIINDNDIIKISDQRTYIKNYAIPLIEKYSQDSLAQSSVGEKQVLDYVKSIFNSEIIENDRKAIKPYELDIYIPSKNVAIEFDGTYWHSFNAGAPKDYHLMKTRMCEEKGIRLIHIFEYEWEHKQDICKSIISSSLGLYDFKVYARNCSVKEVDSKLAKQFLEDNHIQGSINSSYRLGLFYNDELVQLICIGKSRFKKDEVELLRMCTKLHTQVIGGFSKLMKYQPYNIINSYVDRSKFNGKGYLESNFEVISETFPAYHYVKDNLVLNRVSAQKHKLKKLLGNNFDENKTEIQNMIDNGYLMLYDCGNIKMRYEK